MKKTRKLHPLMLVCMMICLMMGTASAQVLPLLAEEESSDSSGNNIVKYIIIALIIGLIVGLIYLAKLKGDLKSVRQDNKAVNYLDKSSFELTLEEDIFIREHTEKRARPKKDE